MDENFSATTRALHHKVELENARPTVTPLFQSSAFEADSAYFYTRKDNPNSAEFEQVVATLEGARHGICVTTGMTAIALAATLLPTGGRLVINKTIYGCTYKFFQRLARRNHLDLVILDLTESEAMGAYDAPCDMLFFETPTNPFLYTVPIRETVRAVRARNSQAIVVVDNTWATPLYQQPLALGADISLHSATKYFSGHSDVMGGVLLTDRDDLNEHLLAERFYTGAILDPHSAWLLRRSLQTFPLRMQAHADATREMLRFLESLPQVEKVYYPEIDGQQLRDYGSIIFFRLAEPYKQRYDAVRNSLQLFQSGTAMASVTSMVAQPFSGSHASLSDEEKREMEIGEDLVRFCFGLESVEDLKKDICNALGKL